MIKIFLDSSNINEIKKWNKNPLISGFTCNPTLMRKAGVKDYEKFAKEVLEIVGDKPVSFEVLADEFDEMERQARIISSWGKNVYVKIPITNTKGESLVDLINKLLNSQVKVNATAITEWKQYKNIIGTPVIVSIFAGRIADTGRNPIRFFEHQGFPDAEGYLWASPREVLNIYQAEEAGADIITCTPELLEKYYKFKGMYLNELSLLTVKQFFED